MIDSASEESRADLNEDTATKQWGWWFGGAVLGVYIIASAAAVWGPALPHFTKLDEVVAALGTIAASIAAAYGVLSYNAIQAQLKLARQELIAVQKDLTYSQQQAHLISQQMRELQRKPKLRVCYEDGTADGAARIPTTGEPIAFRLGVANGGSRTATNVICEVYIPKDIAEVGNPVFTVATIEYRRLQFIKPTVWPTDIPFVFESNLIMRRTIGTYLLIWRVFDDFGKYPEEKDFGSLTISITE